MNSQSHLIEISTIVEAVVLLNFSGTTHMPLIAVKGLRNNY